MAAAMVSASEPEAGTLLYDWYCDDERGVGVLYEAYTDVEAVMTHALGPVFTEVAPEYEDALHISSVQVFGDAGELASDGDLLGAPTKWWGPSVSAVSR